MKKTTARIKRSTQERRPATTKHGRRVRGKGDKLNRQMREVPLKIREAMAVTEPAIAWGKKVTSAFKTRVISICKSISCHPDHLMAAMAFETGETFSPSKKNPVSGATGLIQFMPKTAESLGTTTDALAQMTAEQQLEYVKKYFEPYQGKMDSIEDMYMAILWPTAVPLPNNTVLFETPTAAYKQNSGLDQNRDGKVTKTEAGHFVRLKLTKGLLPENAG